MDQLPREQIAELMDDIKFISASIRKNTGLIRQISLPQTLRMTALFTGIATIMLCFAYYAMAWYYGNHTAAPIALRTSLYCLTGLALCAAIVIKNLNFIHSAQKIDPHISFKHIVRALHEGWYPFYFLPVIVTMVALVGLVIIRERFEYIVPIVSVSYGLMFNSFGVTLRSPSIIIVSHWLVITGLITLFTPWIPPLISLAYSVGLGMLILGLFPWGGKQHQ